MKLFYPLALIAVVIDQVLKAVVRSTMVDGQSIPVIQNVFHLTYLKNFGAGFGLFHTLNLRWIFIALGVLIIAMVIVCHHRVPRKSLPPQLACALILGGAVGNFVDRLLLGHVIDYVDLRIWPSFNFADACLSVGVALLFAWLVTKGKNGIEIPRSKKRGIFAFLTQ